MFLFKSHLFHHAGASPLPDASDDDDLSDIVVTNGGGGSDSTSFVELTSKVWLCLPFILHLHTLDLISKPAVLQSVQLQRQNSHTFNPIGNSQATPELRPPLLHTAQRWQHGGTDSEASTLLYMNGEKPCSGLHSLYIPCRQMYMRRRMNQWNDEEMHCAQILTT